MIEIVAPIRQHHWKWPAVLNFFLGGSSAGLFLHLFWSHIILGNPSVDQITGILFVVPALMAAIGLACLALEAGRPLRGIHLGRHLAQSWMSREALLGVMFITLTIFYALTLRPQLAVAAAVAALLFMLSQGFILSRCRAVAVWNSYAMPMLFFTSGIASGYGMWLFLRVSPRLNPGNLWISWGTVVVVVNFIAWLIFSRFHQHRGKRYPVPLGGKKNIIQVILDGWIPLSAFLGIYYSGFAAGNAKFWLAALGYACGLSLGLGGWFRLNDLLTKSGMMRPVTANLSSYPPMINENHC